MSETPREKIEQARAWWEDCAAPPPDMEWLIRVCEAAIEAHESGGLSEAGDALAEKGDWGWQQKEATIHRLRGAIGGRVA